MNGDYTKGLNQQLRLLTMLHRFWAGMNLYIGYEMRCDGEYQLIELPFSTASLAGGVCDHGGGRGDAWRELCERW